MRHVSNLRGSVAILVAVAAAAVGCAASDDSSSTDTTVDESALIANPSRRDNRSDPFFTTAHPQTGTATLSNGQAIPLPIPFYDLDGFLVYGTMDAAAAEAITAGTGYHPLLTDNGRAFGAFEFDVTGDSGIGRYRDTTFSVLVNKTGGTVPWVNAYSALAPGFNPTTTLFRVGGVIHGEDLAVRAYKEYFGLSLARGQSLFAHDATTMAFATLEGVRSAVAGKLPYVITPAEQQAAAVGLAAAFGLASPADLPPNPPEFRANFVYRSTKCAGCLASYYALDKGHITFRAFDPARDQLRFGNSPYGDKLKSFGFTPSVILVNVNALDVVDLQPLP